MMLAALLPAMLLHKHFAQKKAQGLGRIPVEPHVYGQWPFQGFPRQITLGEPDGSTHTFAIAQWASPFYSGVVQQYRETVPTNAQHLMIFRDGSFLIDHVDEANPDQGLVLQHAVLDVGAPLAAGLAVLGFGAGLVGGLYFFQPSAPSS